MQVRSPRPTSVTALVVLAFILGILSITTGLAGIGLGALVVWEYSGLGATVLLILGTVVFVFGILEIAYGVGFLEGKKWSWTLGMIIALVSLVSSIGVIGITVIAVPGLTSITGLANEITGGVLIIISMIAVIPIITSSVTLYLLSRPHVKAFFGKAPAPQA
jgi:hypothetical protein